MLEHGTRVWAIRWKCRRRWVGFQSPDGSCPCRGKPQTELRRNAGQRRRRAWWQVGTRRRRLQPTARICVRWLIIVQMIITSQMPSHTPLWWLVIEEESRVGWTCSAEPSGGNAAASESPNNPWSRRQSPGESGNVRRSSQNNMSVWVFSGNQRCDAELHHTLTLSGLRTIPQGKAGTQMVRMTVASLWTWCKNTSRLCGQKTFYSSINPGGASKAAQQCLQMWNPKTRWSSKSKGENIKDSWFHSRSLCSINTLQ